MRLINGDALKRRVEEYKLAISSDAQEQDVRMKMLQEFERMIESEPTIDAVPISELRQILLGYFGIGTDCYTYELTRVKEAFEIGTMTFEDFVEWDEEQVEDLINHIICKMRRESADADS